MANDSKQDQAIELHVEAATSDPKMQQPQSAAKAEVQREEEALRLVAQLGLSVALNVAGITPATRKLAFRLHIVANFVAVTLDLLLVVYLLLILTRSIKRHVGAAAKRLMWAALGATYATFVFGSFIELIG